MKVMVIMGNDHPMEVVVAGLEEDRMKQLRKEAQTKWEREGNNKTFGPRFPGSGDYWIRAFEFEVKG